MFYFIKFVLNLRNLVYCMAKKIFSPIDGGTLEGIARILGNTEYGLTGTELSRFIPEAGLNDIDPTNTKWKRLFNSFINYQNQNKNSNLILKFTNITMKPSRFIGESERFEFMRGELNKRLSFIGLTLNEAGVFNPIDTSKTIREAEQRVNRFKSKLENRNIHSKIYEYCNTELIAENYFHSVFEAVKSIFEEIRRKSNLTLDGGELIDRVFSVSNPILKINKLQSGTDISEQKGFANLLKGVFGMFRNTTAHASKIVWNIDEDEALDIMTTVSLIHKKIEKSVTTAN